MTDQDHRPNRATMAASVIGFVLAAPLAVVTGGFAGWCAGASVGEVVGLLGREEIGRTSGIIGAVAGAVFCLVVMAYHLFGRREHAGDQHSSGGPTS